MGSFLLDVRSALRAVTSRRLTTGIAMLTLALGIGANTTVFSVIDAVLFRDVPFPDPDRLVLVWETVPARDQYEAFLAFPNFRDYREGSRAFEDMAAFFANPNQDVNLTGGVEPERVNVARVTSTYFDVLGVHPQIGRAFTDEEDREGNHRVAILSHALWTRQFGGDPDLLGEPVHVNGFPYTVVGVMPHDFRPLGSMALGEEVEMWRPLAASDQQRDARWWRNLRVVGRLSPGAHLATAQRELEEISQRIALEDPENQNGRSVRIVTLHEQSVGGARRSLLLVWGAVGLVLLIACVNVANLLLLQAEARSREMSIRASLGAGRSRILRQLLVESGLLAAAGGGLGIAFAWLGVHGVKRLAAAQTPLLDRAAVDGRVLLFTFVVVGLAAVLFGLVPALHASRTDLTRALKEGGGGSGRRGWGTARVFVVTELALAMVLLVGSGLLIRSFAALRSVDPGFESAGLLTFQLELPMVTKYPLQEERSLFFQELRTRLGALPGVESAATASALPMGDRGGSSTFWVEGLPDPDPTNRPVADLRLTSPEYFGTMGIPVLRGRGIEAGDAPDQPRVGVVSKTLADRVFGSDDPIGATLQIDDRFDVLVVGVAGDVRMAGLAEEPRPAIYVPADQVTYNFMNVVVRTHGSPGALVASVRAELAAMDHELPLHNIREADALLARNVGREAFTSRLVTGFALLALVLAAVGTYGVMAGAVERRRRELGIRLALGAEPRDAFAMVTVEGSKLVGVGLGLGLVAAALLSGVMESLLYGIHPLDFGAYAATALLLGAVGITAVAITAARAARTDPVEPLRTE
ncbi:MAG: ABC transporter permease [Longimicrobiales bacterium]